MGAQGWAQYPLCSVQIACVAHISALALMASENEASTQHERIVPKCEKGHVMVEQQAGSSWMTQVICDKCRGDASEVGAHWSCSICNYDLCAICAQNPQCIKGHKLVRQGVGIGSWFTGMACDECKKSPWKS